MALSVDRQLPVTQEYLAERYTATLKEDTAALPDLKKNLADAKRAQRWPSWPVMVGGFLGIAAAGTGIALLLGRSLKIGAPISALVGGVTMLAIGGTMANNATKKVRSAKEELGWVEGVRWDDDSPPRGGAIEVDKWYLTHGAIEANAQAANYVKVYDHNKDGVINLTHPASITDDERYSYVGGGAVQGDRFSFYDAKQLFDQADMHGNANGVATTNEIAHEIIDMMEPKVLINRSGILRKSAEYFVPHTLSADPSDVHDVYEELSTEHGRSDIPESDSGGSGPKLRDTISWWASY